MESLSPFSFPAPSVPSGPRVGTLGDHKASLVARHRKRHEALTSGVQFIPALTLSEQLNRVMGGGLHPGLHCMHGCFGAGKTALALQISWTCGMPALYLSAEMPAGPTWERVMAQTTGTFLGRFQTAELEPVVFDRLVGQTEQSAPELRIWDVTAAPVTMGELWEIAHKVRENHPSMLIVVDSVHAWAKSLSEGRSEYDYLGDAIGSLDRLGHALDSPVLALVQRNRYGMKQGGSGAMKGHSGFEHTAWSILDLSVADSPVPMDPDPSVKLVELKIEKNRYGVQDQTFSFVFDGKTQTFTEA